MRRDYEKWAKNPVATRASASRTLFQYQDQPHRDCIGALDALPEDSSQTYRITILHSDLKKEVVGMRMEFNRMLTEMMLQMDTTKKHCCKMLKRMDARDKEIREMRQRLP